MAKNFKLLQKKMSRPSHARSEAKARKFIQDMALDELREARNLTQENLAGRLRVNQAAISKLERRADMYLSTLRRVIEAMGGRLEIAARFPEGSIRIRHLRPSKRTRRLAS